MKANHNEAHNGKQVYTYTAKANFGDAEKNFEITSKSPLNGMTQADRLHKEIIKQALSEGKTIPEEVLKDYPELLREGDMVFGSSQTGEENDTPREIRSGNDEKGGKQGIRRDEIPTDTGPNEEKSGREKIELKNKDTPVTPELSENQKKINELEKKLLDDLGILIPDDKKVKFQKDPEAAKKTLATAIELVDKYINEGTTSILDMYKNLYTKYGSNGELVLRELFNSIKNGYTGLMSTVSDEIADKMDDMKLVRSINIEDLLQGLGTSSGLSTTEPIDSTSHKEAPSTSAGPALTQDEESWLNTLTPYGDEVSLVSKLMKSSLSLMRTNFVNSFDMISPSEIQYAKYFKGIQGQKNLNTEFLKRFIDVSNGMGAIWRIKAEKSLRVKFTSRSQSPDYISFPIS